MKAPGAVTILGDGGWGTALSICLSRNGHTVLLWSAFLDYAKFLDKKRVNVKFLQGVNIPQSIIIASDLKKALDFSDIIILAVPSQHLRGVLSRIKKVYLQDRFFLSVVKGIENNSLMRMSEVILDELGDIKLAALSGPNIAIEVAKKMPSVAVVASINKKAAKMFQDLLMSEYMRIYTNEDVVGVELGGSLKNVIALACGISDGMGFGTNTKAALVTRGLAEIRRLGVKMGAKADTFFGASGLGDLVTTCMSPRSRNRSVGEAIGQGKKLSAVLKNMDMIAEGVPTTKAAYELSMRYNVDMPITRQIYQVLYNKKSPRTALRDLMSRQKKSE